MKLWLARFKSREEGNASLVTILLLMPVIILLLGLGIDSAKGNYARQSVDGNLQTALVAGASQLDTNTGRINFNAAKNLAITQYTDNRANYGKTLRCATASDLEPGETLQGGSCKWILTEFTISSDRQSIHMKVREFTPNLWLHHVGLDEYTLRLSGSASISYN